ncbi:MAG: tRNA (adenosine(37)-N6)-dimethylallyltransferase MiaA [Nitrospinota bacterium]
MARVSDIPVVALLGATASGKYALALALAEQIPVEIVSVDSMKVYRGMDIGTAKPKIEQRRRLPHHMMDLTDPDEPYTAARFGREAREVIRTIWERGKIPLLVGGSGLYLRAVLGWIFPGPGADPPLREHLHQQARAGGLEALHRRLSRVDPETAAAVGARDVKRIVRALEAYEKTGVPISRLRAEHARKGALFRDPLLLCLRWDRKALYNQTDRRVVSMIDEGWVEEARRLREKNYSPELPALRALGYVTLWAHLDGEMDLEMAVDAIQRETRRFARRQMIWFRGMPGITWVDVPGPGGQGCVGAVLARIEAYLEARGGIAIPSVISTVSVKGQSRDF